MRVRPNPDTRRPLRRRFTLTAAGLLSVLIAVLGVQFAADSGTAESSVTGSAGIAVVSGTPQPWTVSVGSAGTVPAPPSAPTFPETDPVVAGSGYVARIDATDATSTKMLVSLYVTNLSQLAANYSSWSFNVSVYKDWVNASGPDQWGTSVADSTQTLTSDSGTVSWVLDTTSLSSKKLVVRLEGGSFYTLATAETANASLKPKFFVRATQL